jgi:penicillin-binding protein 1B
VIEQVPGETAEGDSEGGGWRSWFGLDRKEEPAPPAEPAPAPQP